MENQHVQWEKTLYIVIFHTYVELPGGIYIKDFMKLQDSSRTNASAEDAGAHSWKNGQRAARSSDAVTPVEETGS